MGISWSPLSGLKGVKPPVEFGEGTWDCSLGPTGKEGPQVVMIGESRGFSRAAMQRMGFPSSYDGELWEPLVWPQGSPVSIRVARGREAFLSSHGGGIGPQDALKGKSQGLSRVVAGDPGFPRLVMVTSGTFSWCLWEVKNTVVFGGSSWDSTWVGALEDVLSRVEAGASVFLSCSDVGLSVCIPFQTRSQVSTCVEAWNSASLSSCQRGFRPSGELNLGPGAPFELATGVSELPSCCEMILG